MIVIENKKYWDDIYKSKIECKPAYDLWLDKYSDILEKVKGKAIIDLGCGSGSDTLYLTERGHKVIACDYSEESINIVNKFMPDVKTILMDISETLPFKDESIDVIIADLSLHYFNKKTTKNIINEIKRVLKNNGYLIGRVNSINDFNYGAKSGKQIENDFYLTEVGYKRFFDEQAIRYYFKNFNIEICEETSIIRYGNEKRAFEFLVRRI